jgi:ATP synthase protein I
MSEGTPPDPLARLGRKLDEARSRSAAGRPPDRPTGGNGASLQQGLGLGFRIGIELVVAVVVATGLGWAIDRWLGTRPWAMIVLFFLGVAAGMLNVYRAVTGISTAAGSRGRSGPQPTKGQWDDDEN